MCYLILNKNDSWYFFGSFIGRQFLRYIKILLLSSRKNQTELVQTHVIAQIVVRPITFYNLLVEAVAVYLKICNTKENKTDVNVSRGNFLRIGETKQSIVGVSFYQKYRYPKDTSMSSKVSIPKYCRYFIASKLFFSILFEKVWIPKRYFDT